MAERREAVGGYLLTRLLEQDSVVEVFLGHDRTDDRPARITLVSTDPNEGPKSIEPFLRMAPEAQGLDHPNIVEILDWGETDDRFFTLTDPFEGSELAALLASGRRDDHERAALIGVEIAGALGHAHGAGVVHGGLGPASVVVTAEDAVRVVDFGIAPTMAQCRSTFDARYVSPERVRHHDLDARSDVYSLGCVLYELVTGQPPFGAEGMATAHLRLETPPVPPRYIEPDIPAALEEIILRALATRPDDRPSSGEALEAELSQFLEEDGRLLAPDTGRRSATDRAFVSYSRADEAYVRKLVRHLEARGIPTWTDRRIASGTRWADRIDAAISAAFAVVVVMSPASQTSDWVQREVLRAQQLDKPLFPLRLDGPDWFTLTNIQQEQVDASCMPGRRFVDDLRRLVPR